MAFTRDPTTGAPEPEGDFLLNAQGEDVVAGVRNTENLADLARRMPEAHAELIDALKRLERHYRDMQDVEYTIEQGRLYILQTRNAKRPAQAAVRFASTRSARACSAGRRPSRRSTRARWTHSSTLHSTRSRPTPS